ncbi:MAG: hypothetical protein A3D44_00315 [Candidatus Staskawiczbacteria bacterium RIFCSPHIGHO2_02_FULL_42_22]|uniref:Uncharacterized protein n=1 Tax=Candidatus Staskawiczbacteria bacterium RIFCSPHIGHO2_02_FULL_42_22 TaxID=1802207 RepID=A0A1G2I2E6_9BACT|nr:MAG: hypothetical protein A3D44_00315 [Candidatus Staskawiczbacteria bacterium RIFCSPHIGHO2_02_FULL_42_22]
MKEIMPVPQEDLEPEAKHEKKYNFEKMAEIEPAAASLVEQLKEAIVNAEYSAILSDDAGGRIPTLILDKIFKEKSPEKIKTYFLAAGIDLHYINESYNKNTEEYKAIIRYLEKMDFGKKKTLIVTQFCGSGKSLESIGLLLRSIGINQFDFASLYKYHISPSKEQLRQSFDRKFESKLFFSKEEKVPKWIIQDHEAISGVRKKMGINPSVEIAASYEHIKKSREDVKLMAERVIEKVWPENK